MLEIGTKVVIKGIIKTVDDEDSVLPYRILCSNGDAFWCRKDTCKPLKSAVAAKTSLNKGSAQRPKRRSARA